MLGLLISLTANAGRVGRNWWRALTPGHSGVGPNVFAAAYAVFAVAVLALTVACRLPAVRLPGPAVTAVHVGLAVLMFTVVIANVFALALWLARLIRLVPRPLPPPVGLAALAVTGALVAGLTAYGAVHAATLRDRAYDLVVTGPASSADQLDVALISDTHLGAILGADFLGRVVDRVNALNPDVVLIAGDVFDGDFDALADPDAIRAQFARLRAPDGVFACLGNHDAGRGAAAMAALLESAGVRVLRDEAVQVGDRFVVAGRRDSSPIGGTEDARRQPLPRWTAEQSGLPVIVLDHQPSNIGEYGEPVDLVVCGHTHGGQIFPGNLIVASLFDAAYGYFQATPDAPQVVTTSGVGTWGPPLRIASDSEVVHLRLTVGH
jgi:predicted MPP superfamily phosphohydrolase